MLIMHAVYILRNLKTPYGMKSGYPGGQTSNPLSQPTAVENIAVVHGQVSV
jgi:hypothetical protein